MKCIVISGNDAYSHSYSCIAIATHMQMSLCMSIRSKFFIVGNFKLYSYSRNHVAS